MIVLAQTALGLVAAAAVLMACCAVVDAAWDYRHPSDTTPAPAMSIAIALLLAALCVGSVYGIIRL